LRGIAGATIYWTITSGLEWDRRSDSARGAHRLEHLPAGAGRSARTLGFASATALSTTLGLVLEALLGVKLLFANREREPDATVFARNGLVFHQNLRGPGADAGFPIM
jgi:hypothetical protein